MKQLVLPGGIKSSTDKKQMGNLFPATSFSKFSDVEKSLLENVTAPVTRFALFTLLLVPINVNTGRIIFLNQNLLSWHIRSKGS